MLPIQPTLSPQNDAPTGLLTASAAAKLLATGQLGARLIQSARVAAALHMAQTTVPRATEAQFMREAAR